MSDAEAGAAVIGAIEAIRPAATGQLELIGLKAWGSDPFARGAWASVADNAKDVSRTDGFTSVASTWRSPAEDSKARSRRPKRRQLRFSRPITNNYNLWLYLNEKLTVPLPHGPT